MAFGDTIREISATLDDSDHTLVAISGVLLTTSTLAGDRFELGGLQVTVDSVTDDEHLVLAYDWPGDPFTGAQCVLHQVAPSRLSAADLNGRILDLVNKLRIFDEAVPTYSVMAFQVNTPPEEMVVGDFAVVGTAGSGAFAGHSNEIAEKVSDTSYRFTVPEHGWNAISKVDNFVRVWTGSMWTSGVGLGANVVYIPGGWDAETDFKVGNAVTHNDRLWLAAADNTNSEPEPDSEDWDLFLEVAADGGAFTLRYQFSSNVDNSTPGNGKLKFNAIPGSATILRLAKQDAVGNAWASLIASIGTSTTSTQKGKIRVVTRGDLTKQVIATVMSVAAVTDAGGDYYNLTLSSPSVSTNAPDDGDEVLFMFQERGDVGATGAKGDKGDKGDTGDAATIVGVSVSTGLAGSSASVTNIGTTHAANFSFTIPRGDKGDQGDSMRPDHVVADLTGRDTYDGAAQDTIVLVEADSDHDGKPWLYAKASASSGDWTSGIEFAQGSLNADQIVYDNTDSGLDATDVKAAIDEVNGRITNLPSAAGLAMVLGS